MFSRSGPSTLISCEVVDHYGETIVRSRYDGTYDKTNLPDELVMSDYFRVQDGKIISLTVIRNSQAGDDGVDVVDCECEMADARGVRRCVRVAGRARGE
jgi:hypothetical protein